MELTAAVLFGLFVALFAWVANHLVHRMGQLESRLIGISERLSRMEGTLSGMSERIDSMDRRRRLGLVEKVG